MSKRSAAVEATRRRILEATMQLHGEQGVLDTSWEDIAERAEVAPATVYRHFPTLDELVPACGAISIDLLALPSDDEIAERFRGARSAKARLVRLVEELFAIYERGERVLWAVRRDRFSVAVLQKDHEQIEERLDAVRAAALEPLELDERQAAAIAAFTDYDCWAALRERGLSGDDAVRATVEGLAASIRR